MGDEESGLRVVTGVANPIGSLGENGFTPIWRGGRLRG